MGRHGRPDTASSLPGRDTGLAAWRVGGMVIAVNRGRQMTLFEERKKGQEGKYAHDKETEFKVAVRRNKLLGLWLAERMGKSGAAAQAYAREVIEADFERPGVDDVIEKLLADCRAAGLDIDEHKLRTRMAALEEEVRQQIAAQ